MHPEQTPPQAPQQPPAPQPLTPTDTDYLDQISAPAQAKMLKPWQLWGIIGSVLALLIIVFMVIINSGGESQSERFTSFTYRLQALESLTKDSSKTIQSSKLRALNASTNAILTGASQETTDLLSTVKLKKLPKEPKGSPIQAEYDELATTLNDARLNAVYDRVYTREIGYQLAKLRAEMNTMYLASKNEQLKAYLEKTDTNLKPLVSQFNEFNNSQS